MERAMGIEPTTFSLGSSGKSLISLTYVPRPQRTKGTSLGRQPIYKKENRRTGWSPERRQSMQEARSNFWSKS